MLNKQEIVKKYEEIKNYTWVGALYGISRQRVHQLVTGYTSPSRKLVFDRVKKIYIPKELKIWTMKKRESLGIFGDVKHIKGGRDKIRELVRIRDKYTCIKCGKIWVEGSRRFDVHHLDPEQEGKKARGEGCTKYDKENMDKMITVCHKCHYNLDVVKNKISIALRGRKSY